MDEIKLNSSQINILEYLTNNQALSPDIDFMELLVELDKLNNYGVIPFNYDLLYKYICFLYNDISIQYIHSVIYMTAINIDSFYEKIESHFVSIPDINNDDSIEKYIIHKDILDILHHLDIYTVFDLKQTSVYLLILLYNNRTVDFINYLDSLKAGLKNEVIIKLTNFLSSIDEEMIKIISLRQGWNGKSQTLEQVGNYFGLTRERIRQKETIITRLFYEFANNYKDIFLGFLIYLFMKYNTKIISLSLLEKEIKDLSKPFLSLLEHINSNQSFYYSIKYEIIFDGNESDYSEYLDKLFKSLPLVIQIGTLNDYYDSLLVFERDLVKKIMPYKYKQKGNIMIKKEYRPNDIILMAVDKLFPNGYRVHSDQDYDFLCQYLKKTYGELIDSVTKRSVEIAIMNRGYGIVNRGTYLNRIYLPRIGEELILRIINYINQEGTIVYYDSLLHQFKDELYQLGIDNRYILKGVIDPELDKYFYTKRDYISKNIDVKSNQSINDYIDKFDSVFTFNDINLRFKGIKNYIIYGVLYNRNDLIWLSNHRFIKTHSIEIDSLPISDIVNECEYLFTSMFSNQISSKKLFARLTILKPEIIKKLSMVKNHYDLFSLLKHILNNKYYFSRPFISKTNSENNHNDIIQNYVRKFEEFDKSTIDDYTSKMNIRDLYSYLEFLETMSDEYVQYDIDSMIRKDLLNIEQHDLDLIEESINLSLVRFDKIETQKYRGYFLLPKFNKKWNKYLFVGIIRTFLSDKYVVDNTTNFYNTTDFIIRRTNL
mgnify:CR=1 FL=1